MQKDAVPTLVVYVTSNVSPSQTTLLASHTASTILLTRTVVALGSITSTLIPLALSLNPLLVANQISESNQQGFDFPNFGSIASATSSLSTRASSLVTGTTAVSVASATTPILATDAGASTKLGLAIALPIAAVCIVGLIVFGLFLLRKRVGTLGQLNKGVGPNMNFGRHMHGMELRAPSYGVQTKALLVYDSSSAPDRTDSSNSFAAAYEPATKKIKPGLLTRISKVFNMPDLPSDFRSPMFLRRFNLLAGERGSKSDAVLDAAISDYPDKKLPLVPLQGSYGTVTRAATPVSISANGQGLPPSDSLYAVVSPYVKRLSDELTVCIGEKVRILKHHSDGWATVKLVSNNEVGVIPLMCVRKCS